MVWTRNNQCHVGEQRQKRANPPWPFSISGEHPHYLDVSVRRNLRTPEEALFSISADNVILAKFVKCPAE